MRVYFDYNATTPLHPAVREAMLPLLGEHFGNPSSIHWAGRDARRKVDDARERVAALLACHPRELVFTSGGTEADNLAVLGGFHAGAARGRHVVVSAIEHPAVLEAARYLAQRHGAEVSEVAPDKDGRVAPDAIAAVLRDDTALVSVMLANNETGVVQPVREIAERARARGVLVHCDAVQAAGKLPLDVAELGVDLLSLSAHKLHGPKGAGALYVRRGLRLPPAQHGGHQERGLRGGTESVAALAGMGAAAELVQRDLAEASAETARLCRRLEDGLRARVRDVAFNGAGAERVGNTVNVSFRGAEGEGVLIGLDMEGLAASSGSACTVGSLEPSHVLVAMGLSPADAHSAVRFSLGRGNTDAEVDYALELIPEVVERVRRLSPAQR